MIEVRIGTSGYSYPGPPPNGWFGAFYPRTKGKRFDALEYYSRFFDTVEINTTFYRPAGPEMARVWAARTPAGFEFAVKVWQKFTHARKIGEEASASQEKWEPPSQADVDIFRRGIEPLEVSGKLGALLFQYPPAFHFTSENIDRLRWSLRALERGCKAVELRHRSWSDHARETEKLLGEHGASWVVIDEPKFDSSVRQEFEPMGEVFYLRFHGRNRDKWWSHAEAWERYDYLYSPHEIREIARKLKSAQLSGSGRVRKIFAFFNNHARGQAAVNAIMLGHEMGKPLGARPMEELIGQFPELSGIVPRATEGTLF